MILGASSLACALLLVDFDPAHAATVVEKTQKETTRNGGIQVGARAEQPASMAANLEAPTAPLQTASVDDLELVDAAEELIPMRNLTCNQVQVAQTQPRIPDRLTPRGCDPTPTDTNNDDQPERPDGPDPAALARRAAAGLLINPGRIGILPRRTLTGLPTYYWADNITTRHTSAGPAGLRLGITATPVGYEWAFGDGSVDHGGPGINGDPGDSPIRHTYLAMDLYQVSLTTTWQVSYTLNGRPAVLPDQFTTTATTDLEVSQLRARLTG